MIAVTDLRKAFSAQGIKGFSSANRAAFTAAIEAAEVEAYAEDAARKPVAAPAPKKGECEDCGRRFKASESGHPTLCEVCYDYAGWENTHNDEGHEIAKEEGCPVCDPSLDPRKPRKAGRSRAGMVIIAKGTELHKSETFRVAAEAKGWTVKVTQTFEGTEDDGDSRWVATATKGNDVIELSWEGRAYDYPNSGAFLKGKSRKVRNLKEALRLI